MSGASRMKRSASAAVAWFRDGQIGWWAFVVGLVLLVVMYWILPFGLEHRIAFAGVIFQLVGVVVTAIGIGRLRRFFKLDPVLKSFLKYLSDARYIFISRPPITLTAEMHEGGGDIFAGATVVSGPPNGTIEQRLAWIEERVRGLQASVGAIDNKIGEVARNLRAEIKKEVSAREAGDVKAEDKLKETIIGDWQLEIVGLAYFCVGIILGTVPNLIAGLMLRLGLS